MFETPGEKSEHFLRSNQCPRLGRVIKSPYPVVGQALGRFDFQKFSLIFALGVSFILFGIEKGLEELSDLKNENCMDAKKVILYSKNGHISTKSMFYIIKQAILRPDSF